MKPLKTTVRDDLTIYKLGASVGKPRGCRSDTFFNAFETKDKLTFKITKMNGKSVIRKQIFTISRVKGSYNVYSNWGGGITKTICSNNKNLTLFDPKTPTAWRKRTKALIKSFTGGKNLNELIYPSLKNFSFTRAEVPSYFTRYFKKPNFNKEAMRKLVLKKYKNDEIANKYFEKLYQKGRFNKIAVISKLIGKNVDLHDIILDEDFPRVYRNDSSPKVFNIKYIDYILKNTSIWKAVNG